MATILPLHENDHLNHMINQCEQVAYVWVKICIYARLCLLMTYSLEYHLKNRYHFVLLILH